MMVAQQTRRVPALHAPKADARRWRAHRTERRGVVLFVVVLLVAMVSLAGLGYVAVMSTEHKAVRLRGEELQVEMAVGSGIEMMRTHLQQEFDATDSGRLSADRQFRGVVVMDDGTDHRTRFSVISPKVEAGRISGFRFGVANESARLNLAVLPEWELRSPGAGRDALMQLPGMTQSMADAMLDWVDRDTTPRQFGAEAAYYTGLGVPYGPRNAEPTSLEELLLVRDVTREMLFGLDENFNYQIDPGEQQSASGTMVTSARGETVPWSMLLTVFSVEKNANPEGKAKIDLNERNLSSLHEKLESVIDAELAKFIVLYRQYGPRQLAEESAKATSLRKFEIDLGVRARHEFASVLDLVGASVEMPAKAGQSSRSVVRSPLKASRQAMGETLPNLLDYVTVGGDQVIRGRVSVIEAPEEVLAAVPGMTEELAQRIVARRRAMSPRQDGTRRHPTWLLAEGLVDLEEMKALLPYVTCGGDAYRAQIVGFFDDRGPVSSAEVVVDATSDPPRQVYYKDLRLLGRGYALDALRGTTAGVPEPLEAPKALEVPQF